MPMAPYLLLAVCVVFFVWLFLGSGWTPDERKRLYVIAVFFLAAALFWSLFEQAGSTLNLFADRDTRPTVFGWHYPSSWFQSMNSLFVFSFAPVFAWLWLRMGRRQPSTTAKFALSEILVGVGFAVLVVAAGLAQNGAQVARCWLTVVYAAAHLRRVCTRPIGLSAMTKLAPVRIGGLMMGTWFLATSVGNFFAGRLAGFYESMPLPKLFAIIAAMGIAAGVLLLPLARPVTRMTGDAE
jgi:POT family proton-dependent oligopeptide transporter